MDRALWVRWRKLEGLEGNKPYIFGDGTHADFITLEEWRRYDMKRKDSGV
jgi:hypothetical protein